MSVAGSLRPEGVLEMDRLPTSRGRSTSAARLALCGLVAAGVAAASVAAPASAGSKASSGEGKLSVTVGTPLGLQGTAGVGAHTVLPFTVRDRTGRKIAVQVEYGWDRNGDGVIADGSDPALPSEYERATQVRRDPRDTSRLRAGRNGTVAIYRAHRDGAAHGFVWSSEADLFGMRVVGGRQVLRDATGRPIEDRYEPGTYLMGDDQPGVRLRLRAVVRGSGKAKTDWQVTGAFSVDNTSPPAIRIDGVEVYGAAQDLVAIDWTGFDADSEDANGNGVLDVLRLEDRNGNGVLDQTRLAVHADYHRLADGETVPQSENELAGLAWRACSRAAGEGDADTGIVVAPAPVGGAATFVWNTAPDFYKTGETGGSYLLRITPYDETGNPGRPAYVRAPFVVGAGQ